MKEENQPQERISIDAKRFAQFEKFEAQHKAIAEDRVNDAIAKYLESQGYQILRQNKGHRQGKDIVAQRESSLLWVTIKGYPAGTGKTHPATQARHYFDAAVADVMRYRSESQQVELAVGLPDRPTYKSLAQQIDKRIANMRYIWFDDANDSFKEE